MYCDKTSVNILSALLPQAGISDIVVCPGARNGVLAHNFYQLQQEGVLAVKGGRSFRIHPVTDERSAAFVAIGISVAQGCSPVAVCVTSGTALLNTLPAVAEAACRHIPLLVISADRPLRWINQLDGQTLPQAGALQPYTPTYELPEPSTEDEAHWCRNVASEALLRLTHEGGRPSHINVPLTEPLFSFTTLRLPECRLVQEYAPSSCLELPEKLVKEINDARLPVLYVGQEERGLGQLPLQMDRASQLLLLPELLSNQPGAWRVSLLEQRPELLEELSPDLIVHVGGNLIGKYVKQTLRRLPHCRVVRVEPGGGLPDTFCHLSSVVRSDARSFLQLLSGVLKPNQAVQAAITRLEEARSAVVPPDELQYKVMRSYAESLSRLQERIAAVHFGNSTVIRTAARCFDGGVFPVVCNRGVNGIEGTLSVAVGHALVTGKTNLVFIGDLSFFYDSNALCNRNLPANLSIVLFNNGGGRIFHALPGLDESPARDAFVAASHTFTAKGLAETYGLTYFSARSETEAREAFLSLVACEAQRPVLLEIFCGDNEYQQ